MVLEATVICVDNSEFTRNGDFVPSRLHAQQDAVGLVCHSKKSNPENTVGLISMSTPEVLVTLTSDVQKVVSKMQQVQSSGDICFSTAIRVAHLALRHRQSRNQRMRIVAFVCSPVLDDEKDLVRLGKRLKKENVSLDIINFGEDEANETKLGALLEAVNGKDGTGSHLVTVPAGSMLHDSLMVSPIVAGEDGASTVPGYGSGFEFGIDPNDDPELALALRVSMEEQRARQENDASRAGIQTTEEPAAPEARTAEDEMLARAMAQPDDFSALTEDEQIALALQMSMQGAPDAAATATASGTTENPPSKKAKVEEVEIDDDEDAIMEDPEFLESVLQTLPGVDTKSSEVQEALRKRKKKDDDKSGGPSK